MLYLVLFLVVAALAGVVAALITAEPLWAWVSIGISVLALALLLIDWLRRRPRRTGTLGTTAYGSEEDSEPGETTEVMEVTDPEETYSAAHAAEDEEASETERGTEVLEPAASVSGEQISMNQEPAGAEPAESVSVDSPTTPAHAEAVPAERSLPSEEADTEVPSVERVAAESEAGLSPEGTGPEDGSRADAGSAVEDDTTPGEEDTDAADLLVVSEIDSEVLVVDEYPRYHLEACEWLTARETIPVPVSEARDLGFTPCARCGPDASLAAKHRKKRGKFRSRAARGKSRAEG